MKAIGVRRLLALQYRSLSRDTVATATVISHTATRKMFPSINACLAASALICGTVVNAATVTYDFDVGWVVANPDGLFPRQTIGINGQWPIPPITANVGDRVVVNVKNSLQNQTTSLHFHGIYQNGSTQMDGTSGVSHCPIPPNSTFTYDFKVIAHLNMIGLAIDQ